MKRIVLSTFGSLGDLHPFIALALGLRDRGHDAVIATSEAYRARIEGLGIGFRPVRPDMPDPAAIPELVHRIMDARTGSETVIRELMMPVLRESYEDQRAASEGADLLVSHTLTFGVRLAAEKLGLPWASVMLQPLGFMSVYDPPVLPVGQFVGKLRFLGPAFHRLFFGLGKWSVRNWTIPWHQLRAELGLPATREDPLFAGAHSSRLVLALFSPLFAAPQHDWPPATVATGFPFLDQKGEMPPELTRFLDDGPAPLVFTLGSSAVMDAGRFYEHSAEAARQLGMRAVLLVGTAPENRPRNLPAGVAAFEYAPHAELFPRAAAIVHQGGIGTTAQAMRSGRLMIVMPYAHDQPDNAARVARLGISRTIGRYRYTAARAASAIKALLGNPACIRRSVEVAAHIRQENGVEQACLALEKLLGTLQK